MLNLKSGIFVYPSHIDKQGKRTFICSRNSFHEFPFSTNDTAIMAEHLEKHAKDLCMEASLLRNWEPT